MKTEYHSLIEKNDLEVNKSATQRVCHFLYSAGATALAGASSYFGGAYYVTSTNNILSKKLPVLDNSIAKYTLNTLGAAGTSLRFISQIADLKNKIYSLNNKPKNLLPIIVTILNAMCAGMGAFMLAKIQEEEYELQYDPRWYAIAIPITLGTMEAIEALLGGLDIENVKKLFVALKHQNPSLAINESGLESEFPSLKITKTIAVTGCVFILFSWVTVMDELRRNILFEHEQKATVTSTMKFVIGILGNVLQTLLDLEKLSELTQKIHKKELNATIALVSFLLATTSSSLSFIMGYEFGEETYNGADAENITMATLATLPKISTAFMFIYPALEYSKDVVVKEIKKLDCKLICK